MHEREKSDPPIVAAKPANKPARAGAEPVERRGGAEENAGQDGTRRTPSRASVSPGLDRVRQAARGLKKEKFTALLHHVDGDLLRSAYLALKREAAPGVDGVTWCDYGQDLERKLADLHGRIHRGAYRAQPSRRHYIPKPDGRQRPLGIAALEDKIVQRAIVEVLNAIYEGDFVGFSYGFRPGRSQHDALDALAVGIERTKVNWILDADIAGFFDTVNHDWLIRFLEHRVGDRRVIRLIRKWLKVGVMEDGEVTPGEVGTPRGSPAPSGQGAVISPLLANVYLHPLDERLAVLGHRMVRYADDFVVLCSSREAAEAALAEIRRWVAANGLRLHPDKTHVGDCRKPGEGFDFLGYRFEAGRRLVRKKSWVRLKDGIRMKTRRTRGQSLAQVIADLNPMLRGWFGYFKHAHPGTFVAADKFMRRRLRALLRKQAKRPGFGRCLADHQRWPNAFFATAGLFTLQTAWRAARHSR
jgi:RNA-directed DNA polymerase